MLGRESVRFTTSPPLVSTPPAIRVSDPVIPTSGPTAPGAEEKEHP